MSSWKHDSVAGDVSWREKTRLEKGREKKGRHGRQLEGGVLRKLSRDGFNREKGIIENDGGVLRDFGGVLTIM